MGSSPQWFEPVYSESKTVSMKIDKSALSFYDIESKSWVVESDVFEVLRGNSSRNILLKEVFAVSKSIIFTKLT